MTPQDGLAVVLAVLGVVFAVGVIAGTVTLIFWVLDWYFDRYDA